MTKPNLLGDKALRQIARTVRENTRRTLNPHRPRGRWHGSPNASQLSEIRVGIVRGRLESQFYEIELGALPKSAFGGLDSNCIDCDPCTDVIGAGTADCALVIGDPPSIVQADGEMIVAYDTFSDKIPLKPGTDCVVAKVSGTGSRYGNYGGYGSGDPWVVLNGYHEHIVQYRERWDCCDPDGPPTLLARTPVILIGHECDEIICDACP